MSGPSPFIIPSSPLDRRRLGKYEVVCRLSTGGMSQIYLAQQQGMGGFQKLVVLKTILPDIVGEADFVRMFLDEASITAGFNHPHIAQVYELDTSDDVLFMAMEFVQGCTLVELARACRQAREPIPLGITLQAVRDTALALHYAHTFVDPRGRRQVVIHRDVAEKNIMVTYEGVTKLLDFGIAKALGKSGRTSAGMVKGTSGYMSPEQIRGESLDPRSDLFSLGVVLHECLTGLRLFHGKNAEEGMLSALKNDVAPPSRWNTLVPPEVDEVVMRALAKDREARFTTALELARALERAAPGALWHPEQSGELVLRHFADRRAETRRMLEAAFGDVGPGEVRVQSLIQRMKDAQDRLAQPPGLPLPSPPVPPQAPPPGGVPPPHVSPPAFPFTAETAPRGRSGRQSAAGPFDPPSSRAPAPPLVQRPPAPVAPVDDFASEAKTIPSGVLPEEIRAMRRQLMEAEAAAARSAAAEAPGGPEPRLPPGGTSPGPPREAPSSRALPGGTSPGSPREAPSSRALPGGTSPGSPREASSSRALPVSPPTGLPPPSQATLPRVGRPETGEAPALAPRPTGAAPETQRPRLQPPSPEPALEPGESGGHLVWWWVVVGGLAAGAMVLWLLLGQ